VYNPPSRAGFRGSSETRFAKQKIKHAKGSRRLEPLRMVG